MVTVSFAEQIDEGWSLEAQLSLALVSEQHTGLSTLALSGWCRLTGAQPVGYVAVHYDETPKIQTDLRLSESRGPGETHRFEFATQLLQEPDTQRVEVLLHLGEAWVYLFAGDWSQLAATEPATPPQKKWRWAAQLITKLFNNLFPQRLLSLRHWRGRWQRLQTRLLHRRVHQRLDRLLRRHPDRTPHAAYVAHTALTPRLRAALTEEAKAFSYRPKISILLPIYNSDPNWLAQAIASVQDQIYDHWELCLADDASTHASTRWVLDRLCDDPRIKQMRRTKNGHISACSNSAAGLATGTFVAFLDHDDQLSPDALLEVVRCLQTNPDADILYSDEDKLTARGERYDPQFKPDWSRELLLSYNYINHFTCVRRSLFEEVGRFRMGFEGGQDYDLLLRLVRKTNQVVHIPKILYHWRAHGESTAQAAEQKTYMHSSCQRALEDYLHHERIDAEVVVPEFAARLRLPIHTLRWPRRGMVVAIVLLEEESPEDLREVVERIRAVTDYQNYQIYLGTSQPERWCDTEGAVVLGVGERNQPRSVRYNQLVERLSEELVLFIDPVLEIKDPHWLSQMAGYARLPGVGVVGPALLAADGTRISGGLILGMRDGTAPAHAFHRLPGDTVSYYFQAEVARTVAGIDGRCLLTHRRHFDLLGGFDIQRYPNTMFDIDYCQRLAARGQRTLYAGDVEITDPRLPTTTIDSDRRDDPQELLRFRQRLGRPQDGYYNPNLSEGQAFTLNSDSRLIPANCLRQPPLQTLVVTHNLNLPEGAPRYLHEIVLGLQQRGTLEPTIFSPQPGKGQQTYASLGIPVHLGPIDARKRFVDGQWTPENYAPLQAYLEQLLTQVRPEVVLVNTLMAFPVIEAAAQLTIPTVWIIHESYDWTHRQRVFSPFAQGRCEAAFALATRVIPASHDTAALLATLNRRGNFEVLHNGLHAREFAEYCRRISRADARQWIGADDAHKHILAVGTICERKGQHLLVEAAAQLYRQRDDFCCDLVGLREQVPYAAYLRQMIANHRLDKVVRLIPETDDVFAYYRAADIFVCSSYIETFSRSILEAEAFGLPIVATPCCGVREQVFWDFNALRFPIGDSAALAKSLAGLLEDDGRRQQMAVHSRATFENHLDAGEMLDRYERVMMSVARFGPRYHAAAGDLPALPERRVSGQAA